MAARLVVLTRDSNTSSFGKGSHTLRAFVYDKAGNLGKSAAIGVKVTG